MALRSTFSQKVLHDALSVEVFRFDAHAEGKTRRLHAQLPDQGTAEDGALASPRNGQVKGNLKVHGSFTTAESRIRQYRATSEAGFEAMIRGYSSFIRFLKCARSAEKLFWAS